MSDKPKRRQLTARERAMRKRYTRIASFPDGYQVFLQVDVQGFGVNYTRAYKSEAEWMRDMLAIALARIEL